MPVPVVASCRDRRDVMACERGPVALLTELNQFKQTGSFEPRCAHELALI